MESLANGKFSEVINFRELNAGLRRTSKAPRNDTTSMESLSSLIGKDGGLSALTSLTRVNTSVITDDFPYPQFFDFINYMIVCGETKIYEFNGSALTLKGTFSAGSTWKAMDFHDFIYLSNTKVVVKRDAMSGVYSVTTSYPTANAACNFNGQAILGTPDIEVS